MAAADAAQIATGKTSGLELMEQAGREAAAVIRQSFDDQALERVVVACGAGNNGGDGYVVARLLHEAGLAVVVIAGRAVAELSDDAKTNAEKWQELGGTLLQFDDKRKEALEVLKSATLIIDAVFGTGFSGEPRGVLRELIEAITSSEAKIVALDIPSGVCGTTGAVSDTHIEAQLTISFQAPKIGQVIFPGAAHVGRLVVVDVGIDLSLQPTNAVQRYLLQRPSVTQLASQQLGIVPTGHKGTRGHVAVVGGAKGKVGAVKLSGEAAFRSGAGLVTLVVPGKVAEPLSVELKELMCEGAGEAHSFDQSSIRPLAAALKGKRALVVGPGMGEAPPEVLKALFEFVTAGSLSLVIDADALNIISAHKELRSLIPAGSVLTPHPGEMARLMGLPVSKIEENRLPNATQLAKEVGVVVVLKGARSIVATQEKSFINPVASSVLGTAGSGDVLAGLIAGLLARQVPPLESALLAVYAHGRGGIEASERFSGGPGALASEIGTAAASLLNELAKESLAERAPSPGNPVWVEL